MNWETQGQGWPNRASSRFVQAGSLRWHVQIMGEGPTLLLLHGTGAATHSWRDLMPLLARNFTVVAPDLPGHGFTEAPRPELMSLAGQARLLGRLLDQLAMKPMIAIGHSAGAALLARMTLDGSIAPAAMISLNGALLPLKGPSSQIFPAAARLLAAGTLVPRLFSLHAGNRAWLRHFMDNTGSKIDREGIRLYQQLLSDPGHVSSALRMMAHWQLDTLTPSLPELDCRVMLVGGEVDRMIPPKATLEVGRLLPGAELVMLPGLGHLAHEERPDLVAGLTERLFAESVPALRLAC
ncbi:alpha/beta fold hydrolase BchO [Lichenicola sp.]|uniref:alpha/beta fold hydrolase BchO n=1 Tax=Lichenicola sp. TaxID=2804529 RepID=UPI003AFF67EF